MKRYLSILLAAVTIFTIGCRKDNTKDNENKDTKASPTMTATPTPTEKVSETPVQSSDVQADAMPTATIAADATSSPATTESTEPAETPSATQAVVTSNPTLVPSVNPTQTAAPTAKPTVKPTVAPKTTAPTVKPTAKPTATVKPTAKPTPTPTAKPTVAPYDDAKAQYWVDFAEEYAASIGLRVTDAEEYARYTMDMMHIELGKEHITYSLIDGTKYVAIYHTLKDVVRENSSWDDPIAVYAKRIQSYISEDLTGRLDDYKRVGIKGVCIWYEKYDGEFAHCEDEYQIYIAYSGLNEN